MRDMLAKVVEKGGTGFRARVEGYTAAGKTGTAYKVEGGQYVRKYVAGFCRLRAGSRSADRGGHHDR